MVIRSLQYAWVPLLASWPPELRVVWFEVYVRV